MAEIGFDGESIRRYFKGEYSDIDASYVSKVFCDNDKEDELKHLLFRQFSELMPENEEDKKDLDHILYKIHYEINTKQQKSKRPLSSFIKVFSKIAAILILPVLIYSGIHFYRTTNKGTISRVEIKAPAWTRVQFTLPDGTIGWLNSNSSIKYNKTFLQNRQVSLIGEAYFDVFKDNKRPFIVSTNEICVKVLGTKFNIASYENENNVEVVLEEGKLIFVDKGMNKSYKMNPNDLVVYDKSIKNFSIAEVESKKYSSWIVGKLVFRNDPLDVIARRLGRWFNVDVEVKCSSAYDPRLHATFINESLEEVLDILSQSLEINYRIEGRSLKPDETYSKKKVIITANHKKP